MSIPASGPISFSQIQTVFGGTPPVSLSEYYTNANPAHTQGVTGIPAQGTPIRVGLFQGRSKPATGGTIAAVNLTSVYNALQPFMSEYQNANFYTYSLDQPALNIGDGGGDMYDNGNYTDVFVDGISSSSLGYNTTSPSTVVVNGKTVEVISLGYIHPLIMFARCLQRANIGMRKSGNLGADGGGSWTNYSVYNGSIINGFTVYAWCRHVYNAGDPSIGDLFFVIGDSSTTFHNTNMNTFDPGNTDNGISYMTMDCTNALVGTILLSRPSGAFISQGDCQTVMTNLTNRLRRSMGQIYTFNATSGDANASWCNPWTTFCQSLIGSYTRVTIKGSFDSTGRTTNNSTIANGIAQALRNATDYSAFDSATSFTWVVGTCGGTRALSATGNVCQCESTGWVWRPCINNYNWGGVNTAVCQSPSQTITIEFA